MKRTKECPKCGSRKVGHLAAQIDADERVVGNVKTLNMRVTSETLPRSLGVSKETVNTGWSNYGVVHPLVGTLEAYICSECGYHETYVKDPRTVEWDKLQDFRWVNPDVSDGGPFR
ncbi:MAG: hypothetical protein ABI867_40940 [Kofleriaceae bacterium]